MVGQDLGKSAAQAWVWTSATTDRKQKQKKQLLHHNLPTYTMH